MKRAWFICIIILVVFAGAAVYGGLQGRGNRKFQKIPGQATDAAGGKRKNRSSSTTVFSSRHPIFRPKRPMPGLKRLKKGPTAE